MLVNNKFIVAKRANKWKVQGKGKWYPYKTLQGFVYTYGPQRLSNTRTGLRIIMNRIDLITMLATAFGGGYILGLAMSSAWC